MLLSTQNVLILFIAFRFGFERPDSQRFTVEKDTPITFANSCCVKNKRCLILFISFGVILLVILLISFKIKFIEIYFLLKRKYYYDIVSFKVNYLKK